MPTSSLADAATVVIPVIVVPFVGAVIETLGGLTSGGSIVALKATSCMTQEPLPASEAVALYEPTAETMRSWAMLPSGLVIMREVKPVPAPFVVVATSLPATSRTLATVVVRVPVLEVPPEPEAPTPPATGLTGSRPRYSRIRTSGKLAAGEKCTVTVLAPARMFLA